MSGYKPPLQLIPRAALLAEARAFDSAKEGRKPWDWTQAPVRNRTDRARAAIGHILQWLDREDTDPDSGASALGSARAQLGILIHCNEHNLGVDDRCPAPADRPVPFTVEMPIQSGPRALTDAEAEAYQHTPAFTGEGLQRRLGDYCPSTPEPNPTANRLPPFEGGPLHNPGTSGNTTFDPEFCSTQEPKQAKRKLFHGDGQPLCTLCNRAPVQSPTGSKCDNCARDELSGVVGHGAG